MFSSLKCVCLPVYLHICTHVRIVCAAYAWCCSTLRLMLWQIWWMNRKPQASRLICQQIPSLKISVGLNMEIFSSRCYSCTKVWEDPVPVQTQRMLNWIDAAVCWNAQKWNWTDNTSSIRFCSAWRTVHSKDTLTYLYLRHVEETGVRSWTNLVASSVKRLRKNTRIWPI